LDHQGFSATRFTQSITRVALPILLDLNLPHVHGHELLTGLRQLPAYQQTPVVIFSSARKESEEQPCLQLGATAYVQKPEELEQFR
jgi:CheY-like chemotaxis protein